MKRVSYFLLISISAFVLCNCSYGQSAHLNTVRITLVDFNIETIADVSCGDFYYSFNQGEKKIKILNSNIELSHLHSSLKQSQTIKNLKSFDVRGKIELQFKNKKEKYCLDKFARFYHNGRYFFNKRLLIYIVEKVYGNHPGYLDTLRRNE